MLTKILGVAVVAALAALVSVGTARADTLTVGGIEFTGTVTATTATLTVQCTSAPECGSLFLGDVTLKGFSFTSASAGTASGGYTFVLGGQNNKGVGDGGGCDSSDTGGAVCFDAPSPTLDQLNTTLFTFTSTLTGGATSGPLHVQATVYDNSAGTQAGGGKVYAISDDLTGGSIPLPPPQVPEPSSLGLLGLGLLGLVAFTLRRPVANLI